MFSSHCVQRYSVTNRSLNRLGALVALCLTLCFQTFCGQQPLQAQGLAAPAPQEPAPTLELRIYNLSELVDSRQEFPYTGDLPAASGAPGFMSSLPSSYGGGIGGGAGGIGGGGSGGGGFFSMPVDPQFGGGMAAGGDSGGMGMGGPGAGMMGGGGGMMGGGLGGGGMSLGLGSGATDVATSLEMNAESITDLITSYVAPESWEQLGGTGSLKQVGSLLLIRQTADVHQQVAAFLKKLTEENPGHQQYQLEVWWLPLNPQERDEFLQSEVKLTDSAQRINYIRTVAEKTQGFHGTVRCLDRTITHFSSGVRKPVVVGVVPVVGGGNATGEQPIVRHLHIGLLLESYITPVASHLLPAEQAGKFSQIRYRAVLTRDDQADLQPVPGKIDRFRLGAHVSEGVGVVQLGHPTIMSSLTSVAIPPLEGTDQNEIYLVMLLTKIGAE